MKKKKLFRPCAVADVASAAVWSNDCRR